MPWIVDTKTRPGILMLRLHGRIADDDVTAFVVAHNDAVDAYMGGDYRVYCDIRGLLPLSPLGASEFERAKKHSASKPNFRGSAVLVDSAVHALQHERTSVSSGVMETELISDDVDELERHLLAVRRGT